MFSGWEQNGKENTFSVKDADGNEIVGFTITGGGYNLNQMRIGGYRRTCRFGKTDNPV